MIKVYIISGFLGSGKTSFIKKLLESSKLGKVMLIENEFGEIGIDGSLFSKGLEIKEINSGCICCSLKGDLLNALNEIKTYDIDSLIIEPSGVGKLSEIMATILSDDDLKLSAHISMVDAKKALSYHRNFKEFFDDQIIGANAIILSKLEDIDSDKLSKVVETLEGLNDEVEILKEPYLAKSGDELFDIITANVCDCECCAGCLGEDEFDLDHDHHHHDHEHHHHHHADEIFDSISFNTDKVFKRDELESLLNSIKDQVVRAKGIVKSDKLSLYFDISGDDIYISRSEADKSVVTLIGENLDIDRMRALFL